MNETIFIVDDDISVREGLTELLESLAFRVQAFASAQNFLTQVKEDAVGCLVLDVYMPGMTGLDLQNELKARNIHLPIIFLTGHGDIPMTVNALKSGAVHFLTKPVREHELIEVIREALEIGRQGCAGAETDAQRACGCENPSHVRLPTHPIARNGPERALPPSRAGTRLTVPSERIRAMAERPVHQGVSQEILS